MLWPYAILLLLSSAWLSSGVKLPFTKQSSGSARSPLALRIASVGSGLGTTNVAASPGDSYESKTEIGNINNIRYTTTVNVNGKSILVALDTGSTDLWVMPPNGLGQVEDTGISLSLKYGDGSYGVQGTIAIAPFEFGNYTIEKQAFLYANKSTITGLTDIGLQGLFGLGLDTHGASPIKTKLASVPNGNQSRGASVLENIFSQHPTEPNFIGFDLVRTQDMEGSKDGSFTIGEYDEDYAAIAQTPKLPQFPRNADRWTLLVDDISVNGKSVPLSSSVSKAPKRKAVALLDTGAPSTIFSVDVLDAIFSQYPTAVKLAEEGQEVSWIVPCNSTALVNFSFSGIEVPIHPLDMSVVFKDVNLFGQNYTFCVSSPSGQNGYSKDFDILLGDDFLRNVYSVYDFGDTLPNGSSYQPYMQLLAKTNFDKAKDQFLSVRNRLLSQVNEVPPAEILDLLTKQIQLNGGRVVSTNSGMKNVANTYARVIVGLLSVNLFIGVILVVLGIGNYIRVSPNTLPYSSKE